MTAPPHVGQARLQTALAFFLTTTKRASGKCARAGPRSRVLLDRLYWVQQLGSLATDSTEQCHVDWRGRHLDSFPISLKHTASVVLLCRPAFRSSEKLQRRYGVSRAAHRRLLLRVCWLFFFYLSLCSVLLPYLSLQLFPLEHSPNPLYPSFPMFSFTSLLLSISLIPFIPPNTKISMHENITS